MIPPLSLMSVENTGNLEEGHDDSVIPLAFDQRRGQGQIAIFALDFGRIGRPCRGPGRQTPILSLFASAGGGHSALGASPVSFR